MDSGLTKGWSLHPQLAHDTVPVGDLPLAQVLLTKDANYPWLILAPRLPGLDEIAATARVLKNITRCDKLNIAALGNQVPQLHVHVVARRHTDAAWPKPVWGIKPPLAYEKEQQDVLLESLRRSLRSEGLTTMDR